MTTIDTSRFDRRRAVLGSAAVATALSARSVAAQGTPEASPVASAVDWSPVEPLLAAAAPQYALLITEVFHMEDRETIFAINPDLSLPIGSSFKFWILGMLTLLVVQEEITWDQMVEITDADRSVPGGDLRYALPGSTYTVRYLAERMMQKSDNTATDTLLRLAGRERVEEFMAQFVADADRNLPLISTRELAMLKFAYPTEKLDAYYAADIDERRRILAEEIDTIPYEALADIDQTAPLEIERVEWFATRDELSRTVEWIYLIGFADELRPAREIIALETQLAFDGELWPYVGFKGGSEMGVLSGSWLMQRNDDRWFIFTVGFMNTEAEIDMPSAVAAMETVRDLMAGIP